MQSGRILGYSRLHSRERPRAGRPTGPRRGAESSEMSQETASPRGSSSATPEPPEPPRNDSSERLGRALGRALARLRALVRAVPGGRLLHAATRRWRLLVGIAVLLVILFLPALDRLATGAAAVANGVTSGGLALSRLEPEALADALQKQAGLLENRPLGLRIAGKRFVLQPSSLGFRVKAGATAQKVLAVGREGPLHERWFGYFRRLFRARDVPLDVEIDASAVEREIATRAAEAITDPPFPGGIRVAGTVVSALPPRAGRVLEKHFEKGVLAALLAPEARDFEPKLVTVPASLAATAADGAAAEASALLKAPVTLRSHEPALELTLAAPELAPTLQTEPDGQRLRLVFDQALLAARFEATRKALEREPVDAKFEVDAQNAISIMPSQTGLRLDVSKLPAALLAAAASPTRSAELPVLHEPAPALDTERASGLGIRGLVSSFTTRHPCCERRVENIHRIADIMNGRVVEPGQTVSVNELVGPRTLKAGFVPAPTIEEGEMVDSIGGGISQFATTFFNALFHGGYDIVERQPHSYWFPRYPMGHEATLSWPKPDIIFKNDTSAGLLVKTSYTDTSITVKLYGDNGGRKVRAEVSGRQNVVPAPVEILPNPAVPPDEEKIKEPGSIGWSVIVSRILTFPDGTKKEEKRRVTYKARPKRVEVHPCRIPKGEKGYTGEHCPEPEHVEELETATP